MPTSPSRATEAENLLDIWITDAHGRRKVGVLERYRDSHFADHVRTAFYYDDKLADEDAVSITMPVRRAPYCPKTAGLVSNLPPIFDQNLPEGALREYLTARYRKLIPSMGDFDLAAITGLGTLGRVRIVPHGHALPDDDTPATPELARIISDPDSLELMDELMEKFADKSAVSGVQPKVLYGAAGTPPQPGAARTTLPLGRYIIKTEGGDFPWLCLNEYLCMRVAAQSGLACPAIRLSESAQMLIIQRFDIARDGTPLGLEDAATLSARTARQKYEGSYEQLVQRMALMVPAAERGPLRLALFKRIAISCALGDGDAHLKNFALVYASPVETATLSPAYDVCCTLAYLRHDQLALSMGGQRAFPDHDRLVEFGRTICLLSRTQINAALDGIAAAIRAGLRDIQDYCDLYPVFAQQCGERMMRTWITLSRRLLKADTGPGRQPATRASPSGKG